MKLSRAQLDLLENIQGKMRKGDVTIIAGKTGFSREYVSTVLSPNIDRFNAAIVTAAVEIITGREQNTKELLQKLTA